MRTKYWDRRRIGREVGKVILLAIGEVGELMTESKG